VTKRQQICKACVTQTVIG